MPVTVGLIITCGEMVYNCSVNYSSPTFANAIQLLARQSYTLYLDGNAEQNIIYFNVKIILDSRTVYVWKFNFSSMLDWKVF